LLEEEDVAVNGRFHSFPKTTSLPRPTQKPRPPFWVAALATEASFVNAGRQGHGIMAIPVGGAEMSRLIMSYRNAWKEAGHAGSGRVMLAFHMFVHETPGVAAAIARAPLNRYISSLVEAASDWTDGTTSADYAGYDKIIAKLKADSFESQVAEGSAWVGTPDEVVQQIRRFTERSGPFEIASLQVNFNDLPRERAAASMELFSRTVAPAFAALAI
jgi:alkanesulfonate monooxygenase SsuD/methylene tetrahydromethanopterin reductase-like flavin-dependent oxidoreductase (luciferase family)